MNKIIETGASTSIQTSNAVVPSTAGDHQDEQTHPVALYLASLGRSATWPERSRRAALSALDRAALVLAGRNRLDGEQAGEPALATDWRALSPARLEALTAELTERFSPSYGAAIIAHVRGVLRADWKQGGMSKERLDRLRAVSVPGGSSEGGGRVLSAFEVGALFRAASSDKKKERGARDGALLALLYGAGLRRGPALALDAGQLDLAGDKLLNVARKRGKHQNVALMGGAGDLLAAWLEVRGDADGPLLARVGRTGRIRHDEAGIVLPLNVRASGRILARLVATAGISPLTPHDLRRTAATRLYESERDIEAVRVWLGHTNVSTTQRYLRLDPTGHAAAVARLKVPV